VKVRVDAARCVGHGRCYVLGPDVFGEDERGHCLVEREDVPPELADQARLGQQNCPEEAIALSDDPAA
jgi:ferredoxin